MNLPSGAFDSAQLAVLEQALQLGCDELGIAADDDRRDLLAEAIMHLASAGRSDLQTLKLEAIALLRNRDLNRYDSHVAENAFGRHPS